jgi:3-oxoacyl-[acyl-carrier-protein] synthase II
MAAVTGPRGVVITGMGGVCALGDRREELFAALCDGARPFGPPTLFAADAVPGQVAAEVPAFAPERYVRPGNIRPLDRTGRLALVGVELALADSGWSLDLRKTHDVGLVVGTMLSGVHTIGEFDRRAQQAGPEYASALDFSNTVLNAAAGQVAIWQHLRGINSTIAAGAASGVQALGYAAQLIRIGRADVLVAGGAEELAFETFLGFSRAGRLACPGDGAGRGVPFDAARCGAVLGEGAAFLVLEAEETATARGATILGRVLGSANGYDPDARTRPVEDGRPLAQTIARALRDSGTDEGAIGAVSASAHGSPALDRREAAGIEAVFGARTPVTAIKAMTGETLGASGALQAMTMIEAMRGGRLPGIAGLATPDPAVGLDIAAATRPLAASRGLVTALTPEGNCAALVLAVD